MPRTCKVCAIKFEPRYNSVQPCCSVSCAYQYAKDLKEKKWKKEKAKRKKELMTLQDWLKICQTTVNKYIRLRDEGQPCISCKNPNMKKVNASHYYNANNHYNVRFNEDNIHSACEKCNQFLSGNLIPYRKYLIEKIGQERFNHLESIARETRKFTIEEVKEIIEYYKAKIKEFK